MAKPKCPKTTAADELRMLHGRIRYYETEIIMVRRDAQDPSRIIKQIDDLTRERDRLNAKIECLQARITHPDEVIAELQRQVKPLRHRAALANPLSPVAKREATKDKMQALKAEMAKLMKETGMTEAELTALLAE